MAPLSSTPTLLEVPGARRAVLLVHGLGGGPYEVQRLAERLTGLGLTTQTVRLPGHGLGPGPMPASTWPEWYGEVERASRALRERHAQVDLVGFSTGAMLVLKLALEEAAQVGDRRLVLLAPFVRVYRPPLVPVSPERLVKSVRFLRSVPRRRPPLKDRALRAEVERCAGFRTFSLESTRSALTLIEDVLPRLEALTLPTLLVQGARDTVVDPSGARVLAQALGGPTELTLLPRSDHLVTLDVDAELALARAASFLTV